MKKNLFFLFLLPALFCGCSATPDNIPPEPGTSEKNNTATEATAATTAPENEENEKGFEGLVFEREICVTNAVGSGNVYSRMAVLQDGRMICIWPTTDGGKRCMKGVFSSDDGLTWGTPQVLFYGEDQTKTLANAEIIQLDNGDILIAYRANDKEITNGNFYSSIRVHVSHDNAKTFVPHSIVKELYETGVSGSVGLWEPNFCMLNGELACFVAIGKSVYTTPIIPSTDIYIWRDNTWVRADYTSDDTGKTNRNGMPIVRQLSTGGYLMSVETARFKTARNSPLLTYLLYSADGKHWTGLTSAHLPVYGATNGSPYWVELPDGRIVVAFQTDEDILGTGIEAVGDKNKITKIVVSKKDVAVEDLHSVSFSEAYDPFGTMPGYFALWPAMLIHKDYLYLYAGTNDPVGHIALVRAYIGDLK
ncbi:MAG: sialidase family protein [Eubacteriales bacterium]